MRGRVNGEDLLRIRRGGLGGAVDPRIAVMDGKLRLVLVFLLRPVDRKRWRRRGGRGLGFDVFKALQKHHLPALLRARQDQGHVLAELGAHAEVDERVVEAGGLGEETGDDAGGARHVEAPGGPHGNHRVRRPGHDESRADHYGNLKRSIRDQSFIHFPARFPVEEIKNTPW